MLSSIEILSNVIMDNAAHEAGLILERARSESVSIKGEGIKIVEALKKDAQKSPVFREVSYNCAKIISLAEFRAKSEILLRKEGILEDILQKIRDEFFLLTRTHEYPSILKKLIMDAVRHLEKDGDTFTGKVNPEDMQALSHSDIEEVAEKLKKQISLDTTPINIAGGVIVYRGDFKVVYDNSLEAIFERKREEMRYKAARFIFEG